MLYYLLLILMGYLLGSILFAHIFGQLILKKDIIRGTKDLNPGTANAFMQGGMLCGILTLIGDMGKGYVRISVTTSEENLDTVISRMKEDGFQY